MPLVDIDNDMGIMKFASGSHKKGAIGSLEISDESEEAYDAYIAKNGFLISKADSMRAGDASFHLGWTIHSAGANHSPKKTREAITIVYFADGAKISPLKNKNQEAGLNAWLNGKKPGEIADGPLNPMLN
jgi:ectoine hydroxylase-related dioxygenase (phytanoyl-CoA dioxygenase family)